MSAKTVDDLPAHARARLARVGPVQARDAMGDGRAVPIG
jgi:hypothetical protein